jgi:hypothetical protein
LGAERRLERVPPVAEPLGIDRAVDSLGWLFPLRAAARLTLGFDQKEFRPGRIEEAEARELEQRARELPRLDRHEAHAVNGRACRRGR